jgi:hypothetical protein
MRIQPSLITRDIKSLIEQDHGTIEGAGEGITDDEGHRR